MSGQDELRDQLVMAALTGIADAMFEAQKAKGTAPAEPVESEFREGIDGVTQTDEFKWGDDAQVVIPYYSQVLVKAWSIVKPEDHESEYDTNNFYDLLREGVEAKAALAEERAQLIQEFRVRCAKLVETLPFVYVAVPGAGAYVDEAATRASMVRAIMGQD